MTSSTQQFSALVEAIGDEIILLGRLRDLGQDVYGPLMRLDVGAVEAWTVDQAQILRQLDETAARRMLAQEACLPGAARGLVGGTELASTVTLQALIERAPRDHARTLRQQGDALRQLRDEIAVVTSRNEILSRQVTQFTCHIGDELVAANREDGYDASGSQADSTPPGNLFTGAL